MSSEDGLSTAIIDVESLRCLHEKSGTYLMELLWRMIRARNSFLNSSLTLQYFLEFLEGEGMEIWTSQTGVSMEC